MILLFLLDADSAIATKHLYICFPGNSDLSCLKHLRTKYMFSFWFHFINTLFCCFRIPPEEVVTTVLWAVPTRASSSSGMSAEVTTTHSTDVNAHARTVPPPALPPKPRRIPVFTPSGLPRPPDHQNHHQVTTIPEETRSELEASRESLTSPVKELANGKLVSPKDGKKPHYEPLTKKNIGTSPQNKGSPSKLPSKPGLQKFMKKPSPSAESSKSTSPPGPSKSPEVSENTYFEFCKGKLKAPQKGGENKLLSPDKKTKSPPSKLLKPKSKSSKSKSGSEKGGSDSELKSPGDSDTSGSPDRPVSKSAPVSPVRDDLLSKKTSGSKGGKQSLLESKFKRRSLKSRGQKLKDSDSSNHKETVSEKPQGKGWKQKGNKKDNSSTLEKQSKGTSQAVVVDLKGRDHKPVSQGNPSVPSNPASRHDLTVPVHRGPGPLSAHSQALGQFTGKAKNKPVVEVRSYQLDKPPADVAPEVPPRRDISPQSEQPRSSLSAFLSRKRRLSPPPVTPVKSDSHNSQKQNPLAVKSISPTEKQPSPTKPIPAVPPKRSTSPPSVPPRLGSLPPVPPHSDSAAVNIVPPTRVESRNQPVQRPASNTLPKSNSDNSKPKVPSFCSQRVSPVPNSVYCELAFRCKSNKEGVCGRPEHLDVRDPRPGSRQSRSVSPCDRSSHNSGSLLSMDTWRGRSVSPCDLSSCRSSSVGSHPSRAVSPSQMSSSSSTGSASSVVCRKGSQGSCDLCRAGKCQSEQGKAGNWVLLVDHAEKGIVPVKPGQPVPESTMQEPNSKSSGKTGKPTSRLVAMKNKLKQSQKKKSEKEQAKKAEKEQAKKGKENFHRFSSHSKHLPECQVGQCNGHIQPLGGGGCIHTRQPRTMTRSLTDENICFSKPDITEMDRRGSRSRTTEIQLDDLPPCIQERALDIGKQRQGFNYFVVRHRADCRLAASANVGISNDCTHQASHPPMRKGENKSMPQLRDPRTRPSPDQLRRILGFSSENKRDGLGDSVSMPTLMKRSHTFQGQVDMDNIPEETAWAQTVRRTRAQRGQGSKGKDTTFFIIARSHYTAVNFNTIWHGINLQWQTWNKVNW